MSARLADRAPSGFVADGQLGHLGDGRVERNHFYEGDQLQLVVRVVAIVGVGLPEVSEFAFVVRNKQNRKLL